MSQTRNTQARNTQAARKKRDPRQRTAEFIAYDALEGPCTKFFHLFVARRMMTVINSRPYPWFLGMLHRLARMLDGADLWELIVLGSAPIWCALALSWRLLSIPASVGGFVEVALAVYLGYWFVLMVFLDRRLDHQDLSRVKNMRYNKAMARETRMMKRRDLRRTREEVAQAAKEAAERGRAKAQTAPAPTPADAVGTMDPSPDLDELLRG
jgi:hypothetical protein